MIKSKQKRIEATPDGSSSSEVVPSWASGPGPLELIRGSRSLSTPLLAPFMLFDWYRERDSLKEPSDLFSRWALKRVNRISKVLIFSEAPIPGYLLKFCMAFAAAMASITNVVVRYDMNARATMTAVPSAHPASWKAAGRVRAPVPTIRLKM